ncbi:hypothetical protein [Micromonospora qiuiae]|nr:hypothetical protein [Micromonospora qiuiae]
MEIAGSIKLAAVMNELSAVRPVFHSEADFQHAFAWALHTLAPSVSVRLEVPQGGREYLDLLCLGADGRRTAVEFKYFTRRWDGADPSTNEPFHLRTHEATDLARQGFVFDIARLERFCLANETMNGLALILSNDRRLWSPAVTARRTRDQEFRIHEGRTLTGILRWGTEGSWFAANERQLAGSYPLAWQEYSQLDGDHGTFRWLAVEVKSRSTGEAV